MHRRGTPIHHPQRRISLGGMRSGQTGQGRGRLPGVGRLTDSAGLMYPTSRLIG
ncbi:uncharacterized protein BO96DRAFT_64438 [Aspergillus niger CBS 101883]|uniref:Uncharacterized protein n=1 Tax=Aspergillus phoenicis ATCC 13157 TaxID=1353007 RepID=A0A370PSY9_ASPPH|nr:uncharacterized protein BO96DRAFT_64438 [Aspergillus niger CBS 101883]PYH56169.1 hypothetical protein BO96DRAFT_64438 [Aspergillus niger CBS 101883]RDK45308.1 hypothetical protein M752DRAFT_117355 [Aspergillus phoenicis ATCC 13157]